VGIVTSDEDAASIFIDTAFGLFLHSPILAISTGIAVAAIITAIKFLRLVR
jgi:hypothetical protein